MQGLCLRHPCRLYSMYVNMAWSQWVGLPVSTSAPSQTSKCVCIYSVCVCLLGRHASRHGCFLLSCGSPFVFSSGCWLLSRCCSSCCSTLSSTGNFWSRRSSFSLCFHFMMQQDYCWLFVHKGQPLLFFVIG